MNCKACTIGILLILAGASFSIAGSQDGVITSFSKVISYQGILKDIGGDPVGDGDYNIVFRIYDAPTAGNLLWMETVSVSTHDGYFDCQLGLTSNLGLPFNRDYYLALQIQGDTQMPERQRFTMNPYSARSDSADVAVWAVNSDMLDGLHSSNYSLTSHNHDAAYVNEGQSNSITSGMIVDGTISTGDIQNGTILFGDIAQNGATNGQVMKWNGSAWAARNDSLGQGSNWNQEGNVLYTNNYLGLSKGSSLSALLGTGVASHVNFGTACTTGTSGSDYSYCTVSGGYGNIASGVAGLISGGRSNISIGNSSAILGGSDNEISADWASISGGSGNRVLGNTSVISGGGSNTASGFKSAIAGGTNNVANAQACFIGGGEGNSITGWNASTIGGYRNFISGNFSSVVGGFCDTLDALAANSFVVGERVYCNTPHRVVLFDSLYSGSLNINRDGRNATVTSYPIQVGCSSSNGNGAYLSAGGVWTNGSSRTFKENFMPFDGEELLSKIANLSVTSYNYKNSNEKHFGPMAEEFVGAFDTGVIRENDGKRDDMYLSAGDVAGVALAGVQELLKQNKELKTENGSMKTMIINLERRITDLEKNR